MSLDRVRAVADAVLYEVHLLSPDPATSRTNHMRWQFEVLGPTWDPMTGPPARRGCSPSTFASVVSARAEEDDGYTRLEVRVDSVSVEHPPDTDSRSRDAAIRTSFIGTHLILEAVGARFVTVVDPPTSAAAAARRCGVRSIPDLQRHRRIRRM